MEGNWRTWKKPPGTWRTCKTLLPCSELSTSLDIMERITGAGMMDRSRGSRTARTQHITAAHFLHYSCFDTVFCTVHLLFKLSLCIRYESIGLYEAKIWVYLHYFQCNRKAKFKWVCNLNRDTQLTTTGSQIHRESMQAHWEFILHWNKTSEMIYL